MSDRFPHNWFWRAEDGRIYSSKKQSVVPPNDEGFKESVDLGIQPTLWPRDIEGNQTDEALADVLAPHGLSVSQDLYLMGYAKKKATALEIQGITVSGKKIASTRESEGLIAGAIQYLGTSSDSVTFICADDVVIDADSEKLKTFQSAILAHRQACFAKRGEALRGIADGTIKDEATIDYLMAQAD